MYVLDPNGDLRGQINKVTTETGETGYWSTAQKHGTPSCVGTWRDLGRATMFSATSQ